GMKKCQGGVGPSLEVCNGLDDNCNGAVDDVPGVGMACTAQGIVTQGACSAAYACVGGMPGPGPNGLTCTQAKGPSREACNGIDDDCNGIVDDVPGIGLPCTDMSVKTQGPCTAAFACNGKAGPGPNGLTCVQKVSPSPELCNGVDDDCDGAIDNNLKDP